MRAALYIRLSKEDVRGKSQGIDSTKVQGEDGRAAIKAQGWKCVAEHLDEDWSGTLVDRPGLSAIRAAARAKKIDVVAVRDLDRLTRLEAARTISILLELLDLGVRVWSYAKRQFISLAGTDGLLTYVEAMAAEGEARKASERIKAGLNARVRDGRAVKRPPWGYKIVVDGERGKRWVKDEATIANVLKVGRTAIEAGSWSAAAIRLNAEGMPSPSGGRWSHTGVRHVATQPLYRGVYEHANERVLHPELRVWSAKEEAAIDALIKRPARPWAQKKRHLATRFLACGVCGGSIVASAESYTCDHHRTHACVGVGYRARHTIDAALVRLVGRMISDEAIAEATEIVRRERAVPPDTRKKEHERLTREIANVERRVASLTDGVAEAANGAERSPLLQKLRAESERLGALKSSLARLDPKVSELDERRWFQELEQSVREARDRLVSGDLDEKIDTIGSVLGGARVRVSRVEVEGKPLWQLRARIDGQLLALGSDSQQKKDIKGDVTGVTVTPVTAAKPVATTAPATPAPSPATATPGTGGAATPHAT